MSDILPTLCPQCGRGVRVDEDGCCAVCGADATGPGVDEVLAEIERLRGRLARVRDFDGAPETDPGGDQQLGLHCGLEDRGITDRYQAVDYGYAQGSERVFEWLRAELAKEPKS